MPSFVMKGMPITARPVIEIATVTPAKITARPGRGRGVGRGLARWHAVMQRLSEARDYEQRVVDPDADSDHRDEDRRDRVEVGQVRQEEEQREGREHGDAGEQDRHARGDERPEDDQQHDQRDQDAERLAGSLLRRRLIGIARVLGTDASLAQPGRHVVLERDDLAARELEAVLGELHLGVADARVGLREALIVVGERAADIGDVLLLAGQPQRVVEGGPTLRRVELAAVCREDDLQDRAVARAELGLEDVCRLLRIRARDHELVLERALERAEREETDQDEQEETAEHGPLRMSRLSARNARE